MKKFFIYTLLIAFVATFALTGCKDSGEGVEEVVAYETLTTHLKSINLDFDHVIKMPTIRNLLCFQLMET